MVELRRTIRFCINPGGEVASGGNGFGGVPSMHGLGRYYEIDATCRGVPNAATGYLINIKDIDVAVHEGAVPLIADACSHRPTAAPESFVAGVFAAVGDRLGARGVRLISLRWRLTPTYSVEMHAADTSQAIIRQQFDFAAAHRLHVPSMGADANVATFGKCNNPAGHGHNYRIETAFAVPTGEGHAAPLVRLEQIVGRALIDRFDHKHLNVDTPEFNTEHGVNPSVENIAKVFFSILSQAVVRETGGSIVLRSITVWETDRTCATYPVSG